MKTELEEGNYRQHGENHCRTEGDGIGQEDLEKDHTQSHYGSFIVQWTLMMSLFLSRGFVQTLLCYHSTHILARWYVKEWTRLSLNGIWSQPEDRVVWRKHINRVE